MMYESTNPAAATPIGAPAPLRCKPWCDTADHADFIREQLGILTDDELSVCRSHQLDEHLHEIRNGVSGAILRPGGVSYELDAVQNGQLEVMRMFAMETGEPNGERITLDLTMGEARSLAAQIVDLCDRVEFSMYRTAAK